MKDAWYNKIEAVVIMVLLTIMTFIMFFSVVSRYLFNFTFSWAEQFTRILFVWVTFAGISLAALRGAHMRVSAIVLLLGERKSRLIFRIGDITAALFGFGISWYMYNCMMNAINNDQTFTAIPGLNVGVMYAAGVIGMFAFGVRCIQALAISVKADAAKDREAASDA